MQKVQCILIMTCPVISLYQILVCRVNQHVKLLCLDHYHLGSPLNVKTVCDFFVCACDMKGFGVSSVKY